MFATDQRPLLGGEPAAGTSQAAQVKEFRMERNVVPLAPTAGARQALVTVTGITDRALLEKLLGLGVRAESIVALALIPRVVGQWRPAAPSAAAGSRRPPPLAEEPALNEASRRLVARWAAERPVALLDAWLELQAWLLAPADAAAKAVIRDQALELVAWAKAIGGEHLSPAALAALERAVGDA
jgi:hypothetical protein